MNKAPSAQHIEELLRHQSWLKALARRLAQDEAGAEDLVQETWAAAVQRPPKRAGEIRGWLFGVLKNLASNQRRADARRLAREAQLARKAGAASVADSVDRAVLQTRIAEEVLALDQAGREVVVLRYFEDLPPRVIAARLGISVDSVRKRLQRARERLRARLGREYGEDWRPLCLALAAPSGPGLASTLLFSMSTSTKVIAAAAVLLIGGVTLLLNPPQEPAVGPSLEVEATGPVSAAAGTAPVSSVVEGQRLPLLGTVGGDRRAEFSQLTVRVVWESDSQPIPEVPVSVFTGIPPERVEVGRALTNQDGETVFELPLPTTVTRIFTRASARAPLHGEDCELPLESGDGTHQVLRLPGRGTIAGVVLDQDERPVPSAEVRVWMLDPLDVCVGRGETPFLLVTADAKGEFLIGDVGGRVTLFAETEALMGWRTLTGEVGSGQAIEGVILRVRPSRVLHGRVVSSNAQPIPHARIHSKASPPGTMGHTQSGPSRFISIGLGSFCDAGPDGSFALRIVQGWPYDFEVTHDLFSPVRVEMEAGIEPLVIQMSDSGRITGRVVDLQGQGIPGAKVDYSGHVHREVETDAEGNYLVPGIPRFQARTQEELSSAHLAIHAAGYAIHAVQLEGADMWSGEQAVVIGPGQILAGKLVDTMGNPIPGARIEVVGERRLAGWQVFREAENPTWEERLRVNQTRTEGDGSFQLVDLYPGTFTIKAYSPGSLQPDAVEVAVSGRTDLVLVQGANLDLLINLVLTAIDGATGERCGRFSVRLEHERQRWIRSSDVEAEEFEVLDLPEGPIRYWVDSDAGWSRGILRDLNAGTNRVEFRLQDYFVPRRFRLLGAAGEPLPGWLIEAHDSDNRPVGLDRRTPGQMLGCWWTKTTDANGEVTFYIPPGPVYIVVGKKGDEGSTRRWLLNLPAEDAGVRDLRLP
ncbi:MAG: sigma-70 family RNA polymerase sigma factor [Planctomycetes bacterium]|nr:sigma-70 family RNA polymerase sigma factor [Planctomycetota bacterium]